VVALVQQAVQPVLLVVLGIGDRALGDRRERPVGVSVGSDVGDSVSVIPVSVSPLSVPIGSSLAESVAVSVAISDGAFPPQPAIAVAIPAPAATRNPRRLESFTMVRNTGNGDLYLPVNLYFDGNRHH
jgi:hypothetical protein